MGFIRNINGIPLFSTSSEAISWGKKNLGISGFHAHRYAGMNTYMAGATHQQLTAAQEKRFNDSRQGNLMRVDETPLTASNVIQNMPKPRVRVTTTGQEAEPGNVPRIMQDPIIAQNRPNPPVASVERIAGGVITTSGGSGGGY